jgi:hypothetical protein
MRLLLDEGVAVELVDDAVVFVSFVTCGERKVRRNTGLAAYGLPKHFLELGAPDIPVRPGPN